MLEIERQLIEILNTMEVPINRKELTKGNLLWLKRNLWIKNHKHPKIEEADDLIHDIILIKRIIQ